MPTSDWPCRTNCPVTLVILQSLRSSILRLWLVRTNDWSMLVRLLNKLPDRLNVSKFGADCRIVFGLISAQLAMWLLLMYRNRRLGNKVNAFSGIWWIILSDKSKVVRSGTVSLNFGNSFNWLLDTSILWTID